MCGILALLFIAVPALEVYVILQVGSFAGAGVTFALIVLSGIAGAALARGQGLAAARQVQAALAEGRRVGTSLVAAALVLAAAVMMLTPGFVTDIVGLALLVPPLRTVLAGVIVRRMGDRVVTHVVGIPPQAGGPAAPRRPEDPAEHEPPPPGVIDV